MEDEVLWCGMWKVRFWDVEDEVLWCGMWKVRVWGAEDVEYGCVGVEDEGVCCAQVLDRVLCTVPRLCVCVCVCVVRKS